MPEHSAADQILEQAYQLPYGAKRVEMLALAANRLESEGELEHVFSLRLQLTHEADSVYLHERALEAFAWCRAMQRQDPQRFPQNVLPAFERLVHSLIAKIPLAKHQALLDDFEHATRAQGESLYGVYWQRQVAAWFRGDEAGADHWVALQVRETPRPDDCVALKLEFLVRRLAERGDSAQALATAEPLLTGKLRPWDVTNPVNNLLLLPLLRLGRKRQAEAFFRAALKPTLQRPKPNSSVGYFLRYLALVEHWDEAVPLLSQYLVPVTQFASKSYGFYLYEGAWILCEKLRRRPMPYLPIRLPSTIPLTKTDQGYGTGELADWLLAEMRTVADAYDRINESTRFADLMKRDEALVETTFA